MWTPNRTSAERLSLSPVDLQNLKMVRKRPSGRHHSQGCLTFLCCTSVPHYSFASEQHRHPQNKHCYRSVHADKVWSGEFPNVGTSTVQAPLPVVPEKRQEQRPFPLQLSPPLLAGLPETPCHYSPCLHPRRPNLRRFFSSAMWPSQCVE